MMTRLFKAFLRSLAKGFSEGLETLETTDLKPAIYIEADLGGIARLVPDFRNKASITRSDSQEFFGFPVGIKVMLTLYDSLLSVQ